jgi:hypothetical protein
MFAKSLAAVLRLWSRRPHTRAEMLDLMAAVGVEADDAEAVLSKGLASGFLHAEGERFRAMEKPCGPPGSS